MKNNKAIETFNVLSQLNDEKGFPIKFEYGIVKNLSKLERVAKDLQMVGAKKLEGQEGYNKKRNDILKSVADKDDKNNPIIKSQNQSGTQYQITNLSALNAKIEILDKEYDELLKLVKVRNEEIEELLEKEVEDFEPHTIDIKYLPLKEGKLQITILQLTHLMPFLTGDIDSILDE